MRHALLLLMIAGLVEAGTPSPIARWRIESGNANVGVYCDGGACGIYVTSDGGPCSQQSDGGVVCVGPQVFPNGRKTFSGRVDIGFPDPGAGDAGDLAANGLRVWGPVEMRGKPGTVARGNVNGYVVCGSVDSTEGACWFTQDGTPPGDLNFNLVGNGSTFEVSALNTLALSIQDTPGLYLYNEVAPYGTVPFTLVLRYLVVGYDSAGSAADRACAEKGLCVGAGGIETDGGVRPIRRPLATCSAALEGAIQTDVLSGLATGKRTKTCVCSSSGSSTYVWQNVVTATLGTSTTCGTE